MNEQQYGGLPPLSKIAMLVQWIPLLAKLEAVADAKTPHARALAIVAALKAASEKTDTKADDNILDHIEKILSTKEGAAFVEWFAVVMEAMK